MSTSGGDSHDPYRTDGPRPPAAPEPLPQVEQTPRSRGAALRLTLLAVASIALAFFAPPIGAVFGIVTIVSAVRQGPRISTSTRVLGVLAGGAAIAIGVIASIVVMVFADEITEYSNCLRGANTQLARQNCQDTFEESIRSRLGL